MQNLHQATIKAVMALEEHGEYGVAKELLLAFIGVRRDHERLTKGSDTRSNRYLRQ